MDDNEDRNSQRAMSAQKNRNQDDNVSTASKSSARKNKARESFNAGKSALKNASKVYNRTQPVHCDEQF